MDPRLCPPDAGFRRNANMNQGKKIDENSINIEKSFPRSLLAILRSDPKFIDKLSRATFKEGDWGNQLQKLINSPNLPVLLSGLRIKEADEVYNYISKELNGILPETAVSITESQTQSYSNIRALSKLASDKDIIVFKFQNVKDFQNPENAWGFIKATIETKKLKGLTVKKGDLRFPLIWNNKSWFLYKTYDASEYPTWERAIIGCFELEMMPELLVYTESQEPCEELKITKDIDDKIDKLKRKIRKWDYKIPTTIKSDFAGKLRVLMQTREKSGMQAKPENQMILKKGDAIIEPQKMYINKKDNEDLPDLQTQVNKDNPIKKYPGPFNRAPAPNTENFFTIPKAPRRAEDLPSMNPPEANIQPAQINKNTEEIVIQPGSNEIKAFKMPTQVMPKAFNNPINARPNPVFPSVPMPPKPADNENPLPNIDNPPTQIKTSTDYKAPFIIPKQIPSANNPADKSKPNPTQKINSNNAIPEIVIPSMVRPQQPPSNLIKNDIPEIVIPSMTRPTNLVKINKNPEIPIPSMIKPQQAPPNLIKNDTLPDIEVPSMMKPQQIPQNLQKLDTKALNLSSTDDLPDISAPFPNSQPKQLQNPPFFPPQFPPQMPILNKPSGQPQNIPNLPQFPPQIPILSKPPNFQIPSNKPLDSFDAKIGVRVVNSDSENESDNEESDSESESAEESSKSDEQIEECEFIVEPKYPNNAPLPPFNKVGQQINAQVNNPNKMIFSPPFPKIPVAQTLIQPNQEQIRNIPQKYPYKDETQYNPPQKEDIKLLTPFKSPDHHPQPPAFAKAPINSSPPPMSIPQESDKFDPKKHWICEFCTLRNTVDVYICDACAQTDAIQRKLLNSKP